MTTPPPRRRRLWRWLAAFVGGCCALIGGTLWLDDFMSRKAWTDACAEADRLDPGWRWDDLMAVRPVPPDEQNVAVRVQEIRDVVPQGWPDWMTLLNDADLPPAPPGGDALVETPEGRRQAFGSELEADLFGGMPNRRLQPRQLAALRKAVATLPAAWAKANGLEKLSPGRPSREKNQPLLNDLFSSRIQNLRAVAATLRYHSSLLAQDGQFDAALADCRGMLSIQRAAMAEPLFINALVAIAIRAIAVAQTERVLAQGDAGVEALDLTRRAIEAALSEPVIREALRGERAFLDDLVRSVDQGLLEDSKAFGDDPPPKVIGVQWIDYCVARVRGPGPWTRQHSAAVLRYHTFLTEIAKESPDALRTRSAEIVAYRAAMNSRVGKATESFELILLADRRSRALLASAAVVLAAEQFRHANNRWPESLGELVAEKLLAAAPRDPFDGQPLRMRRLPDGLVIYSVSQDLVDDGGEVRVDPKVGGQPKDVGIRLWDVPHRKRSPLNR